MKAFIRVLSLAAIVLTSSSCSTDTAAEPKGVVSGPASTTAAPRPSSLPSASLSVCKVAGDGLGAGQVFTFGATLLGATRALTVAAGSCVTLSVPRESSPLGKGTYKARPDLVAEVIPASAKLAIDDAHMAAAEVQDVLQAAVNVQAQSSLLLNLAQQLLAGDLNVLRGVQPSAEVLQALLQANAQIQIATSQGQIDIATTLTPAQLSALVDALTAFNEGKTKLPVSPASADLQLTEVLLANTQVGAITCQPTTRCSGVDLVNRRVTATVTSGETTIATYTNVGRPVLRVCKVAGAGIAAGTVFTFNAVRVGTVFTTTFTVAAGGCAEVILEETSYDVSEGNGPETAVSLISCDPAVRCSSTQAQLSAAVVTLAKGTTTVTFTNRSTLGTLRVCKVAGRGITAGTVFHFTAQPTAGSPTALDVAAGVCSDVNVREGEYGVRETDSPGSAVSLIACEPTARCQTVVNQSQTAVAVVANEVTTVRFHNESTLGKLRVCKTAGPGVTAGTVFRFNLSSFALATSLDVAAGSCGEVAVEQGSYLLFEPNTSQFGYEAVSISCEPSIHCSNTSILQNGSGSVMVSVVAQITTTATFVNRYTLGTLRVCKVAGAGVATGAGFQFEVRRFVTGSLKLAPQIAAGSCLDFLVDADTYLVVEPHMSPFFAVSAISCVPVVQCAGIDVQATGAGQVAATVAAGAITTVSFTNIATP